MHSLPSELPLQVFVYGTLKPGYSAYEQLCRSTVVRATAAQARGQLYHLPLGYPAMTLGNDWVQGYLLGFSTLDLLPTLDDYEDYDPRQSGANNLYNRELIEVFTPTTPEQSQHILLTRAWVYLMDLKRVNSIGGIYLPSGDWQEVAG